MSFKFCSECNENYLTNEKFCMICSNELILNENLNEEERNNNLNNNNSNNNSNNNNSNEINERISNMLDIFGINFENEIINYYLNNLNYKLSEEYILNLNKIEIENRNIILFNCVLTIGPLKINGISSSFSLLPFNKLNNNNLQLIQSIPICGEQELQNNNLNLNQNNNNNLILYFERGIVSFYTKALRAQNIGAKAVIISQNSPKWPFIMTNSTNQHQEQHQEQEPITIPVIMVSQSDGQLISKYLLQSTQNPQEISIQCEELEKQCIICQELFQCGDIVLKLGCCHIYHETCLMKWLTNSTTCPLCRLQLPTEKKISSNNSNNNNNNNNNSQQQSQTHRMNYFV